MARGRMISKTLGTHSKKFAKLRTFANGLFAQALYPLLVASADDFGRMDGDAFSVKHGIWSTAPEDETAFDAALNTLHTVNLVIRYTVDGATYLQIVEFERHQVGLHNRTKSRFPEPPGFQESSGMSLLREQNRTELNRTEQKGTVHAGPRAPEDAGLRRRPPAGRSDGVMAGSLPRDHMSHAACSPTFSACVPSAVHAKLRAALAPRYGGDQSQADTALRAWYDEVFDALPADTVMGDAFRFWQPRFDQQFATPAPPPPKRAERPSGPAVPGVEATKARLRYDTSDQATGSLRDAIRASGGRV